MPPDRVESDTQTDKQMNTVTLAHALRVNKLELLTRQPTLPRPVIMTKISWNARCSLLFQQNR